MYCSGEELVTMDGYVTQSRDESELSGTRREGEGGKKENKEEDKEEVSEHRWRV